MSTAVLEFATTVRCGECHRLIAKIRNRVAEGDVELELQCPRCRALTTVTVHRL